MSERSGEDRSKVEGAKSRSRHLRGGIADGLASGEVSHFEEDDTQVLKFHGVYQQDDRDLRIPNRKAGLDKAWMFMIRLNIPGGALTPEQYLDLDRMSDLYGNGTLRITTRQSIQYHGVLKGNLRTLIAEINGAMLTTLAACGDVQRNVMACPAPIDDGPHREVMDLARRIAKELLPRTKAYHGIWVDGERVEDSSGSEEEPFYGETYLPRKFKTGIALDSDNSIDVYSYDCGLIGLSDGDRVRGYNVVVGGGMGMTHKKPDTVARLATALGFVAPEHAVEAVRTVAAVFRDHGNRADRRHARLKYLIEEWGMDRFREEFSSRVSWTLGAPEPMPTLRQLDYLGRHEQGNGKQFYGVFVQNGRVGDRDGVRMRTALREAVDELRPSVHLTPMQSVIFGGLEPSGVDRLIEILHGHGVATEESISNVVRFSMACPALPTCGLALAESERVMPSMLEEIEAELERLGLGDVELIVRMTGCPNGCARPYNADIGFVGRKPGVYHVYVGGGLAGDRMADLFAADVPAEETVETLRPLLTRFRDERTTGESLGDFYQRVIGRSEVRGLITGAEEPTAALVQIGLPE